MKASLSHSARFFFAFIVSAHLVLPQAYGDVSPKSSTPGLESTLPMLAFFDPISLGYACIFGGGALGTAWFLDRSSDDAPSSSKRPSWESDSKTAKKKKVAKEKVDCSNERIADLNQQKEAYKARLKASREHWAAWFHERPESSRRPRAAADIAHWKANIAIVDRDLNKIKREKNKRAHAKAGKRKNHTGKCGAILVAFGLLSWGSEAYAECMASNEPDAFENEVKEHVERVEQLAEDGFFQKYKSEGLSDEDARLEAKSALADFKESIATGADPVQMLRLYVPAEKVDESLANFEALKDVLKESEETLNNQSPNDNTKGVSTTTTLVGTTKTEGVSHSKSPQ